MKRYFVSFLLVMPFVACEMIGSDKAKNTETAIVIKSEEENGRIKIEDNTAQELRAMYATIDNFTLLSSRKFENAEAYREFGELLKHHLERIETHGNIKGEQSVMLKSKLDLISEQINILDQMKIEECRVSLKEINRIFAEIEESFNFKI